MSAKIKDFPENGMKRQKAGIGQGRRETVVSLFNRNNRK
jgi:hypothetical protein